jgi:hypothetical protein
MKFLIQLFAISVLCGSTVYAADDSFLFKATVHDPEADAIPVEISLSTNSVRRVDIGDGLVLEFTTPNNKADGAQTMVRLLRKDGDAFRILHTTRQELMNGAPLENAYLVCGERVTFMSPPKTSLPECRT